MAWSEGHRSLVVLARLAVLAGQFDFLLLPFQRTHPPWTAPFDAVHDTANMPLEDKPQRVRADMQAVLAPP